MTIDLAVATAESAVSWLDSECPDVYFTSGYGTAAATTESGIWHIAHWQDMIMVPYVLRSVDGGGSDAVSPYGYSGIFAAPACSPAQLARFWSLAVDRWRECGMVTLFLRFSPLHPASVQAAHDLDGVVLTRRADTITVAVNRGIDQVWDGMEGRSRTAIRKARNVGLRGEIRVVGDGDVAPGSAFRRLYEQTMIRVGSSPGYFFPDVYYQRLVAGLGKHLLVAEVREPGGAVVASALVLRHHERAHYHLAGSTPEAARDGANNLLLWMIFEWAAEHGCATVHLGGGVRPDDGLFRFKRSFGGTRTPFWTGAVVLDAVRYDALLTARAEALGRTTDEIRASGFFPGYRLEASERCDR